jgi:hypothetical protein
MTLEGVFHHRFLIDLASVRGKRQGLLLSFASTILMLMASLLLMTWMSASRASKALMCVLFQSALKSLRRIYLHDLSIEGMPDAQRTWKVRMGSRA